MGLTDKAILSRALGLSTMGRHAVLSLALGVFSVAVGAVDPLGKFVRDAVVAPHTAGSHNMNREEAPKEVATESRRPQTENQLISDQNRALKKIAQLHQSEQAPGASLCAAHGLEPRSTPAVVVDVVRFSVEHDLLMLRLEELGDHVDSFILVSSQSSSDTEAPDAFRSVYSKWGSKLRLVNGGDGAVWAQQDILSWVSRGHTTVTKLDAHVMLSEVNQIPSRGSVEVLKHCSGPLPMAIPMRQFLRTFEWEKKQGADATKVFSLTQLLETPTTMDMALDATASARDFGAFSRLKGCARTASPCGWQCTECGAAALALEPTGSSDVSLHDGRCSGRICATLQLVTDLAGLPDTVRSQPDIFFPLLGKTLDVKLTSQSQQSARAGLVRGEGVDLQAVQGNSAVREVTLETSRAIGKLATVAHGAPKKAVANTVKEETTKADPPPPSTPPVKEPQWKQQAQARDQERARIKQMQAAAAASKQNSTSTSTPDAPTETKPTQPKAEPSTLKDKAPTFKQMQNGHRDAIRASKEVFRTAFPWAKPALGGR